MEFASDVLLESNPWEFELLDDPLLLDPLDATTLTKEDTMSHLSNHDYSLNSPLISDEIDQFVDWMRGKDLSKRFKSEKWGRMRSLFGLKANYFNIRKGEDFTRWFGQFNLRTKYKECPEFNMILQDAFACSIKTRCVLDAFLKGWTGRKLDWSKLGTLKIGSVGLKWGHYFWSLHLLTLLLNCTTHSEFKFLISQLCCSGEDIDGHYTFAIDLPNFGRVIVGYGFALFLDMDLFLDRHTVLMMKDTYVARFNTFLTTKNRPDNIFPEDVHMKLATFYKLGDKILSEGGTKGYDSIKLVEAICNNRMVQITQTYRPLIILPDDFNNHIHTSVRDKSSDTPSILNLFSHISAESNIEVLLTYYGSFRHWGHPFLDYLTGLEKLYSQVTMLKNIDKKYADTLASDLALLVIRSQFKKKKLWPVNVELVPDDHPLREFIVQNIWPNQSTITNFGPNWHKLPLKKCFDIPDVIDPSVIYSDKSHSLSRKELVQHLRNKPHARIPSHKVLSSLLANSATNWPVFLKEVNDNGLQDDQLIIGLKGKERELKVEGRFFALMSWALREYFVMTEYLIKTHFVPLFDGLTMADDLTTVIGKMLNNTDGQGESNYDKITYSDHIDYQKWNNHQRGDANNPTFRVMGQFLGYPKLIERTHEFFEKSWIYYTGRSDLLGVTETGELINRTEKRVCWAGQAGGLEGLRQKGWSIVNLLIIKRESASVNTSVKVLAQGDNQVICSRYRLRQSRDPAQLVKNLLDVSQNNVKLMSRIAAGTGKLGLLINEDETIKSTEFLNYGKHCMIRGNLRNLETKRWSRVTCVTNDQLPTLANVMSTTSSNALTVSHFSDSPVSSMVLYNFYGHFVRRICEFHNPALRGPVDHVLKTPPLDFYSLRYLVGSLYLDPSIGGVCGMSLTRFLIRVFPDPITESLSFLKIVHDNTENKELKELMIQFGNPDIKQSMTPDYNKLVEDPLSLNIPRGIDAVTMIKEAIKKAMMTSTAKIGNEIVCSAVSHLTNEEASFMHHIGSISPLFPRFLSEYRSGTYFGIVDSIVGLFQNSKTIRNQFRGKLSVKYDGVIIESEVYSIRKLLGNAKPGKHKMKRQMWTCSSSQADKLRLISWGKKIHGATVPHPIEMLKQPTISARLCKDCLPGSVSNIHIAVLVPEGFQELKERKGSCSAYLGSTTLESTSILQSWERETKIPFIRRASNLRSAIGWFIEPDSNLAASILNNLQSLTGENWGKRIKGFKRTGSALHRFHCSRQSSGGYTAQNPSKLTRMISTTNSFAELGDANFDFMYQSCLLFALITVGEIHPEDAGSGYYHLHLKCNDCLRPIDEISLDCLEPYLHKDMHLELKSWKPDSVPWSTTTQTIEIQRGPWDILSPEEKSYHVGVAQGFIFGDLIWGASSKAEDPALFPVTIAKKVYPDPYCKGLIVGMIRGGILSIAHQRRLETVLKYHVFILGLVSLTIDHLGRNPNVVNMWRRGDFIHLFSQISHSIPKSYPAINRDISELGVNYLKAELMSIGHRFLRERHSKWDHRIWIFSDICQFDKICLLAISEAIGSLLRMPTLTKHSKEKLDFLRKLSAQVRDSELSNGVNLRSLGGLLTPLLTTRHEVRHSLKGVKPPPLSPSDVEQWGSEYTGNCTAVEVDYKSDKNEVFIPDLNHMRFQNPLISGLRLGQLATGSHYKMREILTYLKVNPRGAICGGDGSGGISALVLRMYPSCRVIFNSLCKYENVQLKGNNPSPPSAISHTLGPTPRCLNYNDCWTHPSDLSKRETWEYFAKVKEQHGLQVDLIILDMEVVDNVVIELIEFQTMIWFSFLASPECILIFKTYLTRIFGSKSNLLEKIGGLYSRVEVVTTSTSSSHTSEVYVIVSHSINQSHLIKKFPDYKALLQAVGSFPLFSTKTEEFRRAVNISKQDMLQGIPSRLLTDPKLDLMNLLNWLGLRSDLSYRYSTHFGGQTGNIYLPVALFCIVLHGLFDFTTGYKDIPAIPSDGDILKLFVWITGFFIWCGVKLQNLNISSVGQDFIDNFIPFNYIVDTRRSLHYPRFSTYEVSYSSKHLQLDGHLAGIGTVIRILQKNYPRSKLFPAVTDINNMCRDFNRSVTYLGVEKATGLLTLLTGKNHANFLGNHLRVSLLSPPEDDFEEDAAHHRY